MTTMLIAFALLSLPAASAKNGLDTARIEQLTVLKGKWNEKEAVFKVEMPRSDLAVTAAGSKLIPPLGLTAWAAFTKAGAHTVVMGDMVLTEDQINPVMSSANTTPHNANNLFPRSAVAEVRATISNTKNTPLKPAKYPRIPLNSSMLTAASANR